MFAESRLAGRVVIDHRALREVTAFVGPDDDASPAPEHGEPSASQDERDREPGEIPHGGRDHITRVAWRLRADPLYTSRMKRLSFLLVTLVACAGPQQEESTKPAPGVPAPPPKAATPRSSDVSFELPVAEIKGATFEPEALGRYPMPLVDPKKKTTLDK